MKRSSIPGSPTRMWIIHFAFIAAVPIYAAMTMLVRASMANANQVPVFAHPLQVYGALAAISLVELIMGFTVSVWMKTVADQPGDSAQAYLNKRMTELVATDAFFESIAIYGLVGIFLGGIRPWQSLSLMFMALIFLLTVIGRLRSWIDEYHQRLRLETQSV